MQIAPWGSIIGIFLGLVAAFRSVYQKIRKLQQWIKEDLKTNNENK